MGKTVYVVTHGEKYLGANPGMTTAGTRQVKDLRRLLPYIPGQIVSGTGKRHIEVARALGYWVDRYTSLVGGPESLQVESGSKVVVLADGSVIPADKYTGVKDGVASLISVLISLEPDSIVCGGRFSLDMLGVSCPKSATVYAVTILDDAKILIRKVVSPGVVIAVGERI